MSVFQPLEVVGRGSETQLQVDENSMMQFRGLSVESHSAIRSLQTEPITTYKVY